MRRALALFVENNPQLIACAQWLHASWQHVGCPATDLVFMGPGAALGQLPDDVAKVSQQPVADDPSWLGYRYINSLACLNGPGASMLDEYDFLLRTDVDVFLTPAWKHYSPSVFSTGTGHYCNDERVQENLQRIANKFGLQHRGVGNIGATLYGRTPLIREIGELATDLCKYIRTVEFKDDEGAWPSWYAGVSSMYATEMAVNHLVPSLTAPSSRLDHESTSANSIHDCVHVHCFHTDDRFSKFRSARGAYDHISEAELNLDIVRDYCTAMALRARRGHRAVNHSMSPRSARRVAAIDHSKGIPPLRSLRSGMAADGSERRAIGDWLIHCADPIKPLTAPPHPPLSAEAARGLVEQADKHGILPAVLRHFPSPFHTDPAFAAARNDGLARHRSQMAYALMLRSHAESLMQRAAGLPVTIVKGPVFARTIYPSPRLRTFTDVDLLVAAEAEPRLARLLEEQGFRLADYDRNPDRLEWKWISRDNDALMIEVHTNLVHHPELRAAISITFQDLAGIDQTPAALLTVALVHGALHRFERLRHVVDICQAARQIDTPHEEARFEALVQRTGARFAAVAGLDLAGRLFAEPRCSQLAEGLGPARLAGLARLLIARSVVTSTMSPARVYHSWRRQAFRALLKHTTS